MQPPVLVTGASRGIGRAIALQMAAAGHAVAVHCHRQEALAQAVCAQIEAAGGRAKPFRADLADAEAVRAMLVAVRAQMGPIGILVNNAGIAKQGLLSETSPEDWMRLMAVNVTGAFLCIQGVLPDMQRAGKGCIINVSSIWGIVGASCEVAYSTSKAALIGMTRALAKELGPCGIRVNCVAPGVIETDMNAALDAESLALLREQTPLGTLGVPEDIAHAVCFLASPQAAFITGQVLSPNGGIV